MHSLPSIYCFESEDAQECRPPGITDAFGEMVIPDHVGRLQVFVVDRVVGSDQRERRLMMKILSLAAYLLMRLRQQCGRLPATIAPFLAPRNSALGGFQRALGFAIPTRRIDARGVREGSERLYP